MFQRQATPHESLQFDEQVLGYVNVLQIAQDPQLELILPNKRHKIITIKYILIYTMKLVIVR